MKPSLAALGAGVIILGFLALSRVAWIGWPEVIVGLAALVASAANRSKYQPYAGIVLGVATLCLWMIALAAGVVPWLTWLTFVFGIAFVLSSPEVTRPTLPPGSPGPGSGLGPP
jgi:hypothetical protein